MSTDEYERYMIIRAHAAAICDYVDREIDRKTRTGNVSDRIAFRGERLAAIAKTIPSVEPEQEA